MRSLDYCPKNFDEIATAGFKAMGVAPDPSALHISGHDWNQTAMGPALDGVVDVALTRYSRQDTDPEMLVPLGPLPHHEPYLLNGLLRRESGIYDVKVMPSWATSPIFAETHRVDVELLSSPRTVNGVIERLGRKPGEDAFKLVRHPGLGLYTPAQYIRAFANMEAPAADYTDWDDIDDDLSPVGHLSSWLDSGPAACHRISNKAAALDEQYGDSMDAPKDKRAPEVTDFVDKLDGLTNFTRPIFDAIATITPDNTRPIAQVSKDSYVSLDLCVNLEAVGLIPADGTLAESRAAVAKLRHSYRGYIAQLLINVEEEQPRTEDTESERLARIDYWHTIVQESKKAA